MDGCPRTIQLNQPSDVVTPSASPCSGYGFKFASVIGEVLADLATKGVTKFDMSSVSETKLKKNLAEASLSDVIMRTYQ